MHVPTRKKLGIIRMYYAHHIDFFHKAAGRQVNPIQQANEQKLARIFLIVAILVLILIMFS